ncbi:MAG: M23 family metallopeptidase [bacterium]
MKIKTPSKSDKIRLVFFSTGQSDIRQFEFNWRGLFTILGMASLMLSGLFFFSVTICNSLYQNNTHNHLIETNSFLKGKIKLLQNQVKKLSDQMTSLEEDTEDLEVLVGLTSTEYDSLLPQANLLSNNNLIMASAPVDFEYHAKQISEYMTDLETRIENAMKLQGIIEDKFLQTQKEIKHIPSIRPVTGGRVTDRFGNRKDPFIEKIKHHNGIDLAARYGTKIYAAAAGIVEFTRARYRLNKGYGRVIIINHGFGYKTLYGHLSKILVKPGQKVKRWDVIGLSGDTGRATGPHLHYEVWHKGRPQNPEDYILN